MRQAIATVSMGLGLMLFPPQIIMAQQLPLNPVKPTEINSVWGEDAQIWGTSGEAGDKWSLIRAISYSLRYLDTPKAAEVYNNYPVRGITRDRVRRSLIRFQQLLKTAKTPQEFQQAVQKEFTIIIIHVFWIFL